MGCTEELFDPVLESMLIILEEQVVKGARLSI